MIDSLPKPAIPQWLESILDNSERNSKFNLSNILTDSLYYPSAGLDGTPVKFLAGNVYSFIFVDYGINKEDFMSDLTGEGGRQGFKGYHNILLQDVTANDLGMTGWTPRFSPHRNDQERVIERQLPGIHHPFAHWSVWKKNEDNDNAEDPKGFSLLYVCAEMSAAYQGLYYQNNILPLYLSIIQPGSGFGGGWECMQSDDSFFKYVVQSHHLGLPPYLIYGGHGGEELYSQPCWKEYKNEANQPCCEIRSGRYARIWKLSEEFEERNNMVISTYFEQEHNRSGWNW